MACGTAIITAKPLPLTPGGQAVRLQGVHGGHVEEQHLAHELPQRYYLPVVGDDEEEVGEGVEEGAVPDELDAPRLVRYVAADGVEDHAGYNAQGVDEANLGAGSAQRQYV